MTEKNQSSQESNARPPGSNLDKTAISNSQPAATTPFGLNPAEMQGRTTFKEKTLRLVSLAPLALLGLALLGYTAVLYGWFFNIDELRRLFFNQPIRFPTAFWYTWLILAGLPAVLDLSSGPLRWLSRIGLTTSMVAGMVLWLEHLLGADWNTNIPILNLGAESGTLTLPGSMPVDVSFTLWTLSATALILDRFGWSRPWLVQIICIFFAVPSLALVMTACMGCASVLEQFCAATGCVRFYPFNYLELALISLALLLARPTVGLTGVLSLDSIGARLFRIMLMGILSLMPAAFCISMLIRNEIISPSIASVLGLVAVVLIMFGVVFFGARRLDKIDHEKQVTEKSLKELSEKQGTVTAYKMVCFECGKDFPEGWVSCPYDAVELTRVIDKLSHGSIFAEKYEIDKPLGSGGMSTVYKARHVYLDKVVAIKVLNQNLASDPTAVRRFQVEAKAAFDLNHPNLLAVHDFGVSQDGQAYIVMDFLEGHSLADLISAQGRLDIITAIPIFIQIASGLAFAHEKDILHRDIKPSNVMLVKSADGKTVSKIVDFGLAKTYDEKSLKLTQTGEIFGSPIYMSPEQCQGMTLDARSDLYSLGVLMYESLAGQVPIMERNAFETFRAKLSQEAPPFHSDLNIPAWLSATVLALLQRDIDRRPQSAQQVVARLQSYFKAP